MRKKAYSILVVAISTAAFLALLYRAVRRGGPTRPAGSGERGASVGGTGMRGHPLFAATYDTFMHRLETKVLSHLRQRVVGQATGRVLEIGVGTGANLPYYSSTASIVGVEPDPFMLKRARRRSEGSGVRVEYHAVSAEELPFPDASFDTVVSTLVLCSVADQARALSEIRRVLKPGGTLRFIEHVKAPGGLMAHVQDAVTPLWSRIGAGCHLNRRTAEAIAGTGFDVVEVDRRPLPFAPLIVGIARPTRGAGSARVDTRG